MRSAHDVVWVPSELVLRALTSPSGGRDLIHSVTRRIIWAPGTPIDHAVTFVRLFVGRSSAPIVVVSDGDSCKHQPRRTHLPSQLLLRDKVKRSCAVCANNRFAVLPVEGLSIDQQNQALCDTLKLASQDATEFIRQDDAYQDESGLRASLKLCKVRSRTIRAELTQFLADRPGRNKKSKWPTDKEVKWWLERKRINLLLLVANKDLRRVEQEISAVRQSNDRRRAPRKHWNALRIAGTDPGAPLASRAMILDHQTSAEGKFVTADRSQCKKNMRADRQKHYQVPQMSSALNDEVNLALAELHLENRTILDLDPASAAALSAADPCAPMAVADASSAAVRDLQAVLAAARTRRGDADYGLNRVDANALRDRDAPITVAELRQCCGFLNDVGPGTDGLAPALFSMLEEGAAAEAICQLFQNCWSTGVIPTEWREHRTLFLYKGKNSDPFHLGNYRGISIDHLLLKLWSLLLCARLETFLERTHGLSGLQGGFRRLRGPPESVFALSETVRATSTSTSNMVELVFVDIKVAYDSVLHPLLWKRCLSVGVGGKFLAALQAIYHQAVSCVDAEGELLEGVPLLRGVLQGNPLSPLLFNLYIDGVLRELGMLRFKGRPLGLWLPRLQTKSVNDGTAEDYLQCLFFADDGSLMETDHEALQYMLDNLARLLLAIGLEINVPKTKWLLVPPAWAKEDRYKQLKAAALLNPLRVYGQAVALVDEFDYLGVRVWWRWNYDRAWEAAATRARKAYFGGLQGGIQLRAGSLAVQLEFARAKIFSHFNYIASISGAGCDVCSASWRQCDEVVEWTLRTICDVRTCEVNIVALKMESGIWDDGMHIHMLVLRFWRKCCTSNPDTTFARAMRLSIHRLSEWGRRNPFQLWKQKSQFHLQSWAQHLFAAASRFGISFTEVETADPDMLILVQRAANGIWSEVAGDDYIAPDDEVRLCARPMPQHAAQIVQYVEGENCWSLSNGTSFLDATSIWTYAMKCATYAAIRERGNFCRNIVAQKFLMKCCEPDAAGKLPRLHVWAASLSGSSLQPYWNLQNAALARWILRARFDTCPTEDYVRCGFTLGHPRIDNREHRACYLCSPIDNTSGVFWPETLAHTLLLCNHVPLSIRRRKFAVALSKFASRPETKSVTDSAPVPDFQNNSVLFTILQLCTGTGAILGAPILQQQPVSVSSADARAKQQSPQFVRQSQPARQAIAWMQPIFQDWLDIQRDPRRPEMPHQSVGHQFVELVALHLKQMFDSRKVALARSPSFSERSRDPTRRTHPHRPVAGNESGDLIQTPPRNVLSIVRRSARNRSALATLRLGGTPRTRSKSNRKKSRRPQAAIKSRRRPG